MNSYHLSVIDEPDQKDTQAILEGLHRFGIAAVGGRDPMKLAVLLNDDSGKTVGGATGHTILGNFYLTHLWIPDGERSKGHGSRILAAVEQKVFKAGCREVRLETMNAKAVPFYVRHGYEVFSQVPEFIPGFDKLFFRKSNKRFNLSVDGGAPVSARTSL